MNLKFGKIKGEFNCGYNKVKFTEDDVRKVSNVKGTILT